ncbi:unnamed protein product, partial [Sphacelaria rigidula]
YGLRQSPNVWKFTIDTELQNMGFKATASDPCVYTREQQGHYVMIILLFYNILVMGPSVEVSQSVQDTLKTIFSISKLGPVSLTLIVEVTRDSERGGFLKLSQHKYVLNLLQKFKMESCNTVYTPGIANQYTKEPEENILDHEQTKQYRAMVGSPISLA